MRNGKTYDKHIYTRADARRAHNGVLYYRREWHRASLARVNGKRGIGDGRLHSAIATLDSAFRTVYQIGDAARNQRLAFYNKE